MTPLGKRDWRTAGCAALVAAGIAFPAGLLVGGGGADRRTAAAPGRGAPPGGEARAGRNPWSPRIATDPHVVEEQRRVLRALETSCRQMKLHCAEAEQARLRIEAAESAR